MVLLAQNHIVHLVNVFIRVGTSQSVADMTSVHCAHVSEVLEQPINAICHPSFVWQFCSQLSRIISLQLVYFFKLESYLRRGNPCLQTMQ